MENESGGIGREPDISETSSDFDDPVMHADGLIRAGKLDEAEELLNSVLHNVPIGWSPRNETDQFVEYHFWNDNEFMTFVEFYRRTLDKGILWLLISYSKAFYLAAYISIEKQDLISAMRYLDQGLALEPDHPKLLAEKAYILGCLFRDEEALQCLELALTSRPWLTLRQRKECLRAKATTLSNLERYNEAQEILLELKMQDPSDEDNQEQHNKQNELTPERRRAEMEAMLGRVMSKLSPTEQQRMIFLGVAFQKYQERGLEIAEDLMDELGNGKEFNRDKMLVEVEARLNQPPVEVDGTM